MTLIILGLLSGIIVGSGIIYIILKPKLQSVQSIDEEIIQKNNENKKEYEIELNNLKNLHEKIKLCEDNLKDSQIKIDENQEKLFKLQERFNKKSKEAEKSSEKYYQKMMDLQKKKLEIDLKNEKIKYEKAADEYRQEYASVLFGAVDEFQKEMTQKNAELMLLKGSLDHEKAIVLAAIEANKRAFEMKEKENFYRLNLTEDDINEIEELRECLKRLRNPEPLNKVIWKAYYEKPYTDLIGRVVGQGIHCGIYKITNLKNGMCYVGQAVNIAERWRQHIKRGIGAETPTRNKLYPAMLSEGVENFSFEIVEECERNLLNEREDYWQDYFGAKEFGYSIK